MFSFLANILNYFTSGILESDIVTSTLLYYGLIYFAITLLEFFKVAYNSSRLRYEQSVHYATELLTICSNSPMKPQKIEVIETSPKVDEAIGELYNEIPEFPILGMDAEYRKRRNRPHPEVKLLQFATRCGACYLIRINKLTLDEKVLPNSLTRLLSNGELWKTGVAVYNDASFLLEDFPNQFDIRGTFDLRYLAYSFNIPERGLKKLASHLLGIQYGQNRERGGWGNEDLDPAQTMYAAWDAFVGVLLFEKFYKMHAAVVRKSNLQLSDHEILLEFLRKWKWKTSKQFTDDYVYAIFSGCATFLRAIFAL